MAYRQPAIRITQVFTNTSPALVAFALPHVNIGPAFQVVTQGQSATPYAAAQVTIAYPGQNAGTFIDTRPLDPTDLTSWPVTVYLSNAVVSLITGTGTGSVNPYNTNQFTDATSNVFANVKSGDVIQVSGSVMGNNGNYTVRTVVNNNTLQTNETFPAIESGLNYILVRNIQSTVGTIQIPANQVGLSITASNIIIPGALMATVPSFGSVAILSATILVSYRALDVRFSANVRNYPYVGGIAALQADFGLSQIVPQNPAAFAAYVSLSNAAVDTNLLALNQTFYTSEQQAYINAFGIVELTNMYALSVLSQNTSVHTSLQTYIDTVSQPANMQESVGIVNRQLVTTAIVVESSSTLSGDGFSGSGNLTFNDTEAAFITDGVVPGDFINVTSPSGEVGRYLIAAVNSQTQCLIDPSTPVPLAQLGITYFVDRNLQAAEQASVLAAYASTIADRRMVITWPDIVTLPVGSVVTPVPGYFLNSAVAALITGLPTQQGLTNLDIALFTGVVHSTQYFTNDQLNVIAGGGVMIFVQDVLNQTALFCRHQLTSDTSAIKFQELSITKNVDFIAKFIRVNQQKFLGQYNIVDSTLDDLKHSASGIITYLRDNTKLPKIGGVIKSGVLKSLAQDTVNIDSVIEQFSLDIPIPLNNLDVTLYV